MENHGDENAVNDCPVSVLPTYYFEETCEYEMVYTSGTNMWDFWLSEVKYAKCVEWWRTRLMQKIHSNELKKMEHGKCNDLAIALLPSGLAARVKLLADTAIDNSFGAYNVSLLDVDTGEMMTTYIENLYIPDEELVNKKPLAVNCCLNMDQNKFNEKFLHSIRNGPLKVEFKRVTLSNPTKFVVNIFVKIKDRYVSLVDILNENGMGKDKTSFQEGSNFIYQARNIEKKIGFSKGKKVLDIVVPHIESLSCFYVWESLDNVKELNSLMQMMKAYYKSTNVMVPNDFIESVSSGYTCAILDVKELNWCRAEVLNHTKTTDYKGLVQRHYEVLLLDFGSRIEVPVSLMKPLDERFFKFPVFAKRCHLFGLQPSPEFASLDGTDYSKDIIEIFEVLADSGKLTLVEAPTSPDDPPDSVPVILERHKKGDDYVINLELLAHKLVTSSVLDAKKCRTLFENAMKGVTEQLDTQVGLPINQKLINESGDENENNTFDLKPHENKLCSILPSQSKSQVDEDEFKNWNPMEEDYSSSTYTYENIVNDDASALIGYQAHDEERICKNFARHGHCYKGAGCRKEHKAIRPDGWTTDYQLVYGKTFYHLALPETGSTVKLKIMIVTDVCKFYAVLEDAWRYRECSYEFLPIDKLEEDTLENLVDLINSRENVSKLRVLAMPPGVGEIVLCKIQCINLYYRAKVLDTNLEENNFLVLYVDIGMTDWVNAKYMRQIEMHYLNLPFQAIDCELACYGVASDTDGLRRMEIMKKLSSLITQKTLKAVVVKSINPLNKMIVQLYDDSGANIGKTMKFEGYLVDVPNIYQNMKVFPG